MSKEMVSGALNPHSERASEYAIRQYESIRKQTMDCLYISNNTKMTLEQVSLIKGHIFYNKHRLSSGGFRRFDPSYEMAQSWTRLSSKKGKGIQKHDLIMLMHELREIQYISSGRSQQEAHDLANQEFNYGKACNDYYRSLGFNM